VRPRLSRALLGTTVAAQLAYPQLPAARQTAATRAIVALVTATSTLELVERRGARRAAALTAASSLIGFGAEVLGVRTGRPFGPYNYSGRLGPKVADVPVAAAAAWTMMASPAWTVAGWITRRRAARAAVAAGALAAWDLALDPRMVREGYWTWPGGGRYEDVPASNFLGWLVVGGAIFAAWAVLDDGAEDGDADVPLVVYGWTWVGEVAANLLFWRRPRVAAVAGAAMGAFAVPALAARARARGR
jgi:putative membrane protein